MTLPADLWRAGAAQLAAAVRARDVSAREAVEAHLARIEAVNQRLNAVTVVLADQALAAAGRADEAIARGETLGPLHGVPCTIKENIEVAGSATTSGILSLAQAYAERDAPAVERLRAAGAIVIGRTNMPDLGMRWYSESSLWGATLNPWDADRTPGGSSGGEAAALASGMTPLGLGNDYGGSLRYPSQCCGTAALKPGYGRIAMTPREGMPDPAPSGDLFAVTGPMARHIADLRLAFAVLAAPDPRDSRLAPVPLDGPGGELPRVSFTVDPGGLGVDERVAEGVRRAADALARRVPSRRASRVGPRGHRHLGAPRPPSCATPEPPCWSWSTRPGASSSSRPGRRRRRSAARRTWSGVAARGRGRSGPGAPSMPGRSRRAVVHDRRCREWGTGAPCARACASRWSRLPGCPRPRSQEGEPPRGSPRRAARPPPPAGPIASPTPSCAAPDLPCWS